MAILFDKIRYEHQSYSETSAEGKEEIENLAAKLHELEDQILNDPKGSITIMKSGNVFSDSFEPNLAEKITKIITAG